MTTLLRIDASVRAAGSSSRAVADHLQARWSAAHPGGRVIARDLAAAPPPHLTERTAAALLGAPDAAALALSDELIAELASARDLLISTPLYNFGLPSTLKAWFDHIVRAGRTFELRDGAYRPLLSGRTAYVVAARGGLGRPGIDDDFALPYLPVVLRFIGWSGVEVVQVGGTAMASAERQARMASALAAVDQLFSGAPGEPGRRRGVSRHS